MAIATKAPTDESTSPITGGGTNGNTRLTAATGTLLLLALAALGVTIVWIGQLLDVHMFLGIALLAPVGLKLASTGYRFVRYYTHEPRYRAKGPPPLALRLIAPLVAISSIAVFGTGVVLLLAGPAARDPWVLLHKVSFFVWIPFMTLHVLGHILELPDALGTRRAVMAEARPPVPGGSGRALALAGAIVIGAAMGVAAITQFSPWLHGH